MKEGEKIPPCTRCGQPFPDRDCTPAEIWAQGLEDQVPSDFGMVLMGNTPDGPICIDCIEKEDPKWAANMRAIDERMKVDAEFAKKMYGRFTQ